MRGWWELLKRFPTLPPFGESWFRVLRENGHPVAEMRIAWMLENVALDEEERDKTTLAFTEYGAWFANPERVNHVQQDRKRREGSAVPQEAKSIDNSQPFRIVQDKSLFWKAWEAAQAGEVMPVDPAELALLDQIRSGAIPLSGTKSFVPNPDPEMLAELQAMGIDTDALPGVVEARRATLEEEPEGIIDPKSIDWPDPDDDPTRK